MLPLIILNCFKEDSLKISLQEAKNDYDTGTVRAGINLKAYKSLKRLRFDMLLIQEFCCYESDKHFY